MSIKENVESMWDIRNKLLQGAATVYGKRSPYYFSHGYSHVVEVMKKMTNVETDTAKKHYSSFAV